METFKPPRLTPLQKQKLQEFQPGDTIIRLIDGSIPHTVRVCKVTVSEIICGFCNHHDEMWVFNRSTGAEVDEELGWDGVKKTGSIIKL